MRTSVVNGLWTSDAKVPLLYTDGTRPPPPPFGLGAPYGHRSALSPLPFVSVDPM